MSKKPIQYNITKWLVIIILIAVIETIKQFPHFIETYYSTGFYVPLSRFLRITTGWIPFSIGDIFYFILSLIIFIQVILFLKELIKHFSWKFFGNGCLNGLRKILWLYIIFNLVWGLNYYREGIAHQLQLEKYNYCKDDVTQLTHQLIDKVNFYRNQFSDTGLPNISVRQILPEARKNYATIAQQYNFLQYKNPSVKISIISKLGKYFGFTGYYNPFSGEAQFRNDIPSILLPYIVSHEMAHQLGYASESEANFAGYLACSSSNNPYFLYSTYLDLFSYAQAEEIHTYFMDGDTTGLKNALLYNKEHLDSLIIKDRKKIRAFFYNEENKISPAMSAMYNQYLKFNMQNRGVESYNEVIGWLLAYQKKYGKL
jgi:hypothetical protein